MMKKPLVLILAAGKQGNFGDDKQVKQLIDIGGEPLIARTKRQFEQRGGSVLVVTWRIDAFWPYRPIFIPASFETTADTLYSTRYIWDGRVRVLLGDVLYSSRLADMIMGDVHLSWSVFGNSKLMEIFAFTFSEKDFYIHIIKALDAVRRISQKGKLWGVYRVIEHLPSKPSGYKEAIGPHFIEMDGDYSQDFDHVSQIDNPKIDWLSHLDDRIR